MKDMFTRGIIKLFFLFTVAGITVPALGQTYLRDFQDGKVYFKFRDNVAVDIPVNPDRSVDLDRVPMLNNLRDDYDITAMSRPYDLNNDPKLLRIQGAVRMFEPFGEPVLPALRHDDLEPHVVAGGTEAYHCLDEILRFMG